MVEDYLTDRDQEEALRNWWRENWNWILARHRPRPGAAGRLAVLADVPDQRGRRRPRSCTHDFQKALTGNDLEQAKRAADDAGGDHAKSAVHAAGPPVACQEACRRGQLRRGDQARCGRSPTTRSDEELAHVARLRAGAPADPAGKHDEALQAARRREGRRVRRAGARDPRRRPGCERRSRRARARNMPRRLRMSRRGQIDRDRSVELKLQDVGGEVPKPPRRACSAGQRQGESLMIAANPRSRRSLAASLAAAAALADSCRLRQRQGNRSAGRAGRHRRQARRASRVDAPAWAATPNACVWRCGRSSSTERCTRLRTTVKSSRWPPIRASARWVVKTKLALSAGPEVDGGLVVLGSSDGDIVALDATNGTQRWRKAIGSEVLARPLIANDIVVIRTVDGHVEGLAIADGAQRWAVDEQVPRLTLRGTAPPVLAGDRIIAGFDSGKVLAIDPRNGDVLWDAIVNAPRGRTELERLADIDSPARVVRRRHFRRRLPGPRRDAGARFRADLVGARHLQLSRLHHGRRQPVSHQLGQRRDRDEAQRRRRAVGTGRDEAPRPDRAGDRMATRWWSATSRAIVHWLDKATGEIVARQKTDGERITNSAVTDDAGVFVQTDSGKLLAFQQRRPRSANTPTAAEVDEPLPDCDCLTVTAAPKSPDRHWPIDAASHRARRSAQRRQVDAVQLPHAHSRRARRGSARADARP